MKKLLLAVLLTSPISAFCQDDLLKELEGQTSSETEYVFQTFKGSRLVNGHTVESTPAGTLEFIFAHRFGTVDGGLYEMFGLDQAYVRLGLDYGITDNVSVSIGRNSVDKTMDGYFKFRLLRQRTGARAVPVSITGIGGLAYQTFPQQRFAPPGFTNVDRVSYVTQLLIARKFNQNLSLQLMPTYVHRNSVFDMIEKNKQFSIGVGGRIKVSKSVALTSEYYYRFDVPENNPYYNSIGIGVDIETGGHVFQLIMTNSRGLTERAFLTQTEGDVADGDIHLGFNVTRPFQLRNKR